MANPFIYSDTNKRYHTQSYYLKKRFGRKVIKISLNCGFTCPNIDGTKGVGGCTYCSAGSGDFGGSPLLSVSEQFDEVKSRLADKWSEGLYIPYFQANTNTYGPLEKIKAMTEEALLQKNVVGIALSTRPDCIEDDVLEYLAELAKRTYLTVELGLQTIFDETAQQINRCHTYDDFLRCYERLRKNDINVCVHLVNGLPGETKEMMLDSARAMSQLEIHSIKLHLLHIIKGTVMAEQYSRGEFEAMTMEDYVDVVCGQIRLLPPEIVIQRLTGDGAWSTLVAPKWSLKKMPVLNEIDKKLARDDAYQGIDYRKI